MFSWFILHFPTYMFCSGTHYVAIMCKLESNLSVVAVQKELLWTKFIVMGILVLPQPQGFQKRNILGPNFIFANQVH